MRKAGPDMTPQELASEIALRERWLDDERDTLGWLKLRPQVEAELASLRADKAPTVRCKSWSGRAALRAQRSHNGARSTGATACAERVRSARVLEQGPRR